MTTATVASTHKAAGDDAFRAGDFERAIAAYAEALAALASDDSATRSSILCNRSAALMKLSRADEAVRDAASAVAATPDAVKPHYRHACALRAGGAIGEALAACDAGLALAPGHVQLLELAHACADELGRQQQQPPADTGVTAAAAATPPPPEPAPEPARDPDEPDPEENYAGWCRHQGTRLFRSAEFGQACAWYGHAIGALERGEGVGAEAPAVDGALPKASIAQLLSNRAASWLKLRRWAAAAADCERAVALDASLVKAYARGSAALMRLGDTTRSVAMAQAAVDMTAMSEAAMATRLDELRGLSVRELRTRLRDERREAAKRAEDDARAEMGGASRRARTGGERGRNAPCLVGSQAEEAAAKAAAAKAAAAGVGAAGESPLDRAELVREVATLERQRHDASGNSALCRQASPPLLVLPWPRLLGLLPRPPLGLLPRPALLILPWRTPPHPASRARPLGQALAEASSMRERVVEVEAMAHKSDWASVAEHASWLRQEYPEHSALRKLQLAALFELERFSDADALTEEQLQVIATDCL